MAKGLYIGTTENVSKKCKKIYVGIDDVAKKVKKIYIGDSNNIARLNFTSHVPQLVVHETSASLSGSHTRYYNEAGSTKNYALVVGGYYADNTWSDGDAFDNTFTRTKFFLRYAIRNSLGGNSGNIGEYAIFGGHDSSISSSGCQIVNNSLTVSSITYSRAFANYGAFASVGNYCIYGGGSYSSATNEARCINTSLTISRCTDLSTTATQTSGASTKDYAIIAGGNTASDTVTGNGNVYNSSLTRSVIWIKQAYGMSSASFGEDALFGPFPGDASLLTLDRIGNSLTHFKYTTNNAGRMIASTPNFAILSTGNSSFRYHDVFDSSYTMRTISSASLHNYNATSFENYAIFVSTTGSVAFIEEV